jgi:hypothetical protein
VSPARPSEAKARNKTEKATIFSDVEVPDSLSFNRPGYSRFYFEG